MPLSATIRPNLYKDSVALMRVSQRVLEERDVRRATLLMGTPANKAMLEEAALMCADLTAATPSDLMIVVEAETSAALDAASRAIDGLLDAAPAASDDGAPGASSPRSLALAVAHGGPAALAQISVPGAYAGAEALKALKQGLHAFVFSDNVALAEERALKTLALAKGLLVMGPDCGTAIIRGVPLGFANVVRAGPVGLVGASGTGLQEVMCRIHAMGQGISHAIGTGSRDVTEAIGGTTMCQAIDLLAADARTEVIAIVSKPPAPAVADEVVRHAVRAGKPCVLLFLGRRSFIRSARCTTPRPRRSHWRIGFRRCAPQAARPIGSWCCAKRARSRRLSASCAACTRAARSASRRCSRGRRSAFACSRTLAVTRPRRAATSACVPRIVRPISVPTNTRSAARIR